MSAAAGRGASGVLHRPLPKGSGVSECRVPEGGSVARLDPVGQARGLLELTKPAITRMVLVTTAAGYYLGTAAALDLPLLIHTLIGTGLVAGGTNALNQVWEREIDGRMARTRDRPLPSRRVTPGRAVLFSVGICVLGLLHLGLLVGSLPALLAAITLATYVLVYTPLKRRTSWCTDIGAVPGALPILIGWTAATGSISPGGLALFLILFFWQLPHFYALAWMYRDDYRAGGLAVLSVFDADGRRTGRRAVAHALVLIPVSSSPWVLGMVGTAYLGLAALLGAWYAGLAVAMALRPSHQTARGLFLGSITYLPLLLGALVLGSVLR